MSFARTFGTSHLLGFASFRRRAFAFKCDFIRRIVLGRESQVIVFDFVVRSQRQTVILAVWRQRQSVIKIGCQRQPLVIEVLWQREPLVDGFRLGGRGDALVFFKDASTKRVVLDVVLGRDGFAGRDRLGLCYGRLRHDHRRGGRDFRCLRRRDLRESHGFVRDFGSRWLRRRRDLDFEHVFVEQVVIATGLIQIDTKQVLGQPRPIIGGRFVLFFAHSTEGNLCQRVRQPSLPIIHDGARIVKIHLETRKSMVPSLNTRRTDHSEWSMMPIRHIVSLDNLGKLFARVACVERMGSSSFNRGLPEGIGKLVIACRVQDKIGTTGDSPCSG